MAESNVAAAPKETQQSAKPTRKGSLLSRVAYSFGNVGQSAFYNALSTSTKPENIGPKWKAAYTKR